MDTRDNELILGYIEGDTEALTEIVARNIGLVYRYALRMTKDIEQAEDITQETFVKLWRNIHKFDTEKNFRTWILGIAHNTAIDFLRKRKISVFSDFDTKDERNAITDTLADIAPLAPEIFEKEETKKLLDSALEQISPMHHEVLALYYEEDLTFNEIGEILNKPLNTVKSQYRRALEELRKILERNL
ncbi:MAG: RNA polymerase sigma factor [Minisyncoccia bacterium]